MKISNKVWAISMKRMLYTIWVSLILAMQVITPVNALTIGDYHQYEASNAAGEIPLMLNANDQGDLKVSITGITQSYAFTTELLQGQVVIRMARQKVQGSARIFINAQVGQQNQSRQFLISSTKPKAASYHPAPVQIKPILRANSKSVQKIKPHLQIKRITTTKPKPKPVVKVKSLLDPKRTYVTKSIILE